MRKGRSKSITLADVRKLHFPKGAKMIYYTPSKHLPEVLEKHRFLFGGNASFSNIEGFSDLFNESRQFCFPENDKVGYHLRRM